MTGEQIKALEGRLWKAADELITNSKLTAEMLFNDFKERYANYAA